jgi:uncharacterized protein with HEPN domain
MPREAAGVGSAAGVPPREDRERLEHILLCSRDARTIVGDDDAAALATHMVRTRALVNCFTEIGEAAARLSAAGRARVGTLPWRQIVGMRNIVVHVYWGIDVAELVKTSRDDLPTLVTALQSALGSWPADPPADA